MNKDEHFYYQQHYPLDSHTRAYMEEYSQYIEEEADLKAKVQIDNNYNFEKNNGSDGYKATKKLKVYKTSNKFVEIKASPKVFSKEEKINILRKIRNGKLDIKLQMEGLHLVKPTYASIHEYYAVYNQLIHREAKADFLLNKKKSRPSVYTKFKFGQYSIKAFIDYPEVQNFDPSHFLGDQIKLESLNSPKSTNNSNLKKNDSTINEYIKGRVVSISDYYQLIVEIDNQYLKYYFEDEYNSSINTKNEMFKDGYYSIQFIWNETPFERMQEGLAKFQGDARAVSNSIQ